MTVPHGRAANESASTQRESGSRLSNSVPRPVDEQAAARQNSSTKPAPKIVVLFDEIDISNALPACVRLCDAMNGDGALVIADMSQTKFCDSSGFRMLLVANDRASACGSELRFVMSPGEAVVRALALMGFDRLLHVYPSVEEALSDGLHEST